MGLFLSSHFPRLFLLFRPGLGAPRQGSIAPVAARWHDCDERVEVEIDNGLKRLGGGTIAQAVGQRVVPGGILGLQRDQPGDGVVPALSSGPSVRRPTVTDLGKRLLGLAAGAISRLSFGVAEGVLASRVGDLVACSVLRYVTEWYCPIPQGVRWTPRLSVRRLRGARLSRGGLAVRQRSEGSPP